MKILPAITTIFDWRGKIKELKELGLKEVCLFLTCVDFKQRQEIFSLLKDTKIENIPFVHIREDMTREELDYLIKSYKTQFFNIHTKKEHPYSPDYERYKNMIYIENTYEPLDEGEIQKFAGVCLDLAHFDNSRIFKKDLYNHNLRIIEKYGCGCSHIGPIKGFSFYDKRKVYPKNWHPHILEDLSELDYLKRYPSKYFGKFAALEIENSIKKQLEARDYILTFLGDYIK